MGVVIHAEDKFIERRAQNEKDRAAAKMKLLLENYKKSIDKEKGKDK